MFRGVTATWQLEQMTGAGRSRAKNCVRWQFETRRVFGKIRHIGKCLIAFADFFPVLGREFVARVAVEFLLLDVSAVRELRIINSRFLRWSRPRWCAPAGLSEGRLVEIIERADRVEEKADTCCEAKYRKRFCA